VNRMNRTLILTFVGLAPAASAAPPPSSVPSQTAKVVSYSEKDVIPVKAKIRFTTLIVLPKQEQILDFTSGDKEFWIVNGSQNFAYVKPAKAGSRTNLNLITASGNVYSFVLAEVSEATDAEPDLKIFVELKDESMLSATRMASRDLSPPSKLKIIANRSRSQRPRRATPRMSLRRQWSARRVSSGRNIRPASSSPTASSGPSGHLMSPPCTPTASSPTFRRILRSRPPCTSSRTASLISYSSNFAMERISPPRCSTAGIWPSANRSSLSSARNLPRSEVTAMPDPIRDSEQAPVPEGSVRNQMMKPPGILPKNTQTWVIAGLATVMVAAIALSGNGSKSKAPAPPLRQAAVIDANASRIADYRNRLEEETRKLAAEQAALNQAKQAAAGSDPRVAAAAQPTGAANTYAPQHPPPVDDRLSAKKQLEAERERKEYNSLFASNVALTFRKISQETETTASSAASSAASAPPFPAAAAYPYIYPVPPIAPTSNVGVAQGVAPADPATVRTPPAENQDWPEGQRTHPKPDAELTLAEGKTYRLLEGTILETVVTNRLNGSLAGPVNTMLTTDVYSHDRQHLLIPQGSRILGEVKPVASFGQQRLAVVFHRIIMPDGYSVSLDQFQGLNQIGETGLRDQVNHHYLEIFGVSIAIGAIAGLSQANTLYGISESATDAYRQGFAASLSQSSLRILDRFLNILPTFTIREGYRIKVYLASDLPLPAYDHHKIPSDF